MHLLNRIFTCSSFISSTIISPNSALHINNPHKSIVPPFCGYSCSLPGISGNRPGFQATHPKLPSAPAFLLLILLSTRYARIVVLCCQLLLIHNCYLRLKILLPRIDFIYFDCLYFSAVSSGSSFRYHHPLCQNKSTLDRRTAIASLMALDRFLFHLIRLITETASTIGILQVPPRILKATAAYLLALLPRSACNFTSGALSDLRSTESICHDIIITETVPAVRLCLATA